MSQLSNTTLTRRTVGSGIETPGIGDVTAYTALGSAMMCADKSASHFDGGFSKAHAGRIPLKVACMSCYWHNYALCEVSPATPLQRLMTPISHPSPHVKYGSSVTVIVPVEGSMVTFGIVLPFHQ